MDEKNALVTKFTEFKGHKEEILAIDIEGTKLLSCGKDNKAMLWDMTKKDDKGKSFKGHKASI